eukprot:GHUV01007181.1.p1 GENE.GHUV01007181.1~~GHUV01007181.1.p1  ORF type:complete len:247 (+),score=27.52 GHUV01007181.1:42-782(+)
MECLSQPTQHPITVSVGHFWALLFESGITSGSVAVPPVLPRRMFVPPLSRHAPADWMHCQVSYQHSTAATSARKPGRRSAGSAPHQNSRSQHVLARPSAVGRTAYSYETSRLVKTIVTRQAVKTVLNYLSETNGELHFFLHNYISENSLPLAGDTDADEWLIALASSPLTSVQDPRRSSVASVAAAAAVTQGTREVSPRDVAERIMGLREHIAQEVMEELTKITQANTDVRRRALEKTVSEFKITP